MMHTMPFVLQLITKVTRRYPTAGAVAAEKSAMIHNSCLLVLYFKISASLCGYAKLAVALQCLFYCILVFPVHVFCIWLTVCAPPTQGHKMKSRSPECLVRRACVDLLSAGPSGLLSSFLIGFKGDKACFHSQKYLFLCHLSQEASQKKIRFSCLSCQHI